MLFAHVFSWLFPFFPLWLFVLCCFVRCLVLFSSSLSFLASIIVSLPPPLPSIDRVLPSARPVSLKLVAGCHHHDDATKGTGGVGVAGAGVETVCSKAANKEDDATGTPLATDETGFHEERQRGPPTATTTTPPTPRLRPKLLTRHDTQLITTCLLYTSPSPRDRG